MKLSTSISLFSVLLAVTLASAQTPAFSHIVIVFQENRTPDNIFGSNPTFAPGVDLHGSDGFQAPPCGGGNGIGLNPVSLVTCYDLNHTHTAWHDMCDPNSQHQCNMDGACQVGIAKGSCSNYPSNPEYQYVDNSTAAGHPVQPYFDIARFYGWANYMFATNQGPSFPAHQFILSGTSAPVPPNNGLYYDWFASENQSSGNVLGCIAPLGITVAGINPGGTETSTWYQPTWVNSGFPCYEHGTLTDLLDHHTPSAIGWKYYAPSQGTLWTAPNAIYHMCQPSGPGGNCTNQANFGAGGNVVPETTASGGLVPILADISNCNLPPVSWVIPDGRWSDHAGQNEFSGNAGLGPAYVAAIVNAIGESYTKSNKRCDYWGTYSSTSEPTLILITWDDWGGWYDHVAPPPPRNQYELGFRVPLLVVSEYTGTITGGVPQGYVSCPLGGTCNYQMDFGSILKYIENNGNWNLGYIGGNQANYADAQATALDPGFFNNNTTNTPRSFTPIPLPAMYSGMDASYFLGLSGNPGDPDDDNLETPN